MAATRDHGYDQSSNNSVGPQHNMSGYLRLGGLLVSCLFLSNALAQNIQRLEPNAGLGPGDAFAGLADVKIEYYDVNGTDEESINASLQANGPRRPDGRTAMGLTDYYFQFSGVQNKPGPICMISKASITMTSTVHLPRLINEALVPERIMIRWRPFIAALRVHEAGHVRIERDHMKDIMTAVIGSRCDQLQSTMGIATARIKVLQKAYDQETNDGETQGAVLR